MSEIDGVLLVDKPEGPTSHDVVARARRALKTRRIGHTGTLDPFASGLLVLCLGTATRLAEYVTPLRKTYRARLRLGQATDTDDLTGEVISESDAWRSMGEAQLRAALEAQVGDILQLPPIYSAKRVEGERMYAVARRGDEVVRTPVPVSIHRIELTAFDPPFAELEVECSSGTYIRAIARDAGESLGVGAHLTMLRRTRVGSFDVAQAVQLGDLDAPETRSAVMPASAAVSHLPSVSADEAGMLSLRNGGPISAPDDLPDGVPVAIHSPTGDLAAIGARDGGLVRPRKVLL